MIAGSVIEQISQYRDAFVSGEPFQHVAIENFFEPVFAERLLKEFPAFNPALATNEIYGGVWGKAVNTKIGEIGPAYAELYAQIASRDFLDLIGAMTGIPDLVSDPSLYGGGTHENLHGQDLDPHVDFNYDEAQKLHRRLNLIVYLNKDWKAEWGGSLEIHSNPRRPAENRIQAWTPSFNRAVLFETNEHSWHGFPKIELPEGERHRSRKSISIYLYTRERPAHEIAPVHGTFYVHRPLDARFQRGTLTEADEKELLFQVDRRDKWIEKYQQMELDKGVELARQAAYIRELMARVRAPITGYVLQEGGSQGLYADGWTAPQAQFSVRPQKPVQSLSVRGWRPDEADAAEVTVTVSGKRAGFAQVGGGLFSVDVAVAEPLDALFTIAIDCEPALPATGGDDRVRGFMLVEVRAEHS